MNQEEKREEKKQNSTSSHYQEEDEISLIDLLVVLLKYRRLILGITLAAIVLSVAGYIFYPQYQYKKAQENAGVEAYIEVETAPLLATTGVKYSLESVFQSPSLLISALKEAGYEEFAYGEYKVDLYDESQRSRALQLVRLYLVENKNIEGEELSEENRRYNLKSQEEGLEITFKHNDSEKAQNFLEALYKHGSERLREELIPQLRVISTSYSRILDNEDLNISVISEIRRDLERQEAAEQLISGEAELLTIEEEPYVAKPYISLEGFRDSFKIKAIVLVIAALFLSVFLAFVLNAYTNVRKDEESMRKINEALGKK